MKICAAFNCKNQKKGGKLGLHIHRFPFHRPYILDQWVSNIRRANWTPSKGSVLCSDHFLPSCYYPVAANTRRLHEDAVPTIFDYADNKMSGVVKRRVKRGCIVQGCGQSAHSNDGVKYHMPKPDKCDGWATALGGNCRGVFKQGCVVCSRHFDDSDYTTSKTGKTILRRNAVPHVFTVVTKVVTNVKKTKKQTGEGTKRDHHACIVDGCVPRSTRHIKYHRPREEMFDDWVLAVAGRCKKGMTRDFVVCSLHFDADDYSNTDGGETCLNNEAIPHLFDRTETADQPTAPEPPEQVQTKGTEAPAIVNELEAEDSSTVNIQEFRADIEYQINCIQRMKKQGVVKERVAAEVQYESYPKKCCVRACLLVRNPQSALNGIKFHPVPYFHEKFALWEAALRRRTDNSLLKPSDIVCSRHFMRVDYDHSTSKLKTTAVPHVFDSRPLKRVRATPTHPAPSRATQRSHASDYIPSHSTQNSHLASTSVSQPPSVFQPIVIDANSPTVQTTTNSALILAKATQKCDVPSRHKVYVVRKNRKTSALNAILPTRKYGLRSKRGAAKTKQIRPLKPLAKTELKMLLTSAVNDLLINNRLSGGDKENCQSAPHPTPTPDTRPSDSGFVSSRNRFVHLTPGRVASNVSCTSLAGHSMNGAREHPTGAALDRDHCDCQACISAVSTTVGRQIGALTSDILLNIHSYTKPQVDACRRPQCTEIQRLLQKSQLIVENLRARVRTLRNERYRLNRTVTRLMERTVSATDKLELQYKLRQFEDFPVHFFTKRNGKYFTAEQKRFALTLHAHGPKAYEFLERKGFDLPNRYLLAKWYKVEEKRAMLNEEQTRGVSERDQNEQEDSQNEQEYRPNERERRENEGRENEGEGRENEGEGRENEGEGRENEGEGRENEGEGVEEVVIEGDGQEVSESGGMEWQVDGGEVDDGQIIYIQLPEGATFDENMQAIQVYMDLPENAKLLQAGDESRTVTTATQEAESVKTPIARVVPATRASTAHAGVKMSGGARREDGVQVQRVDTGLRQVVGNLQQRLDPGGDRKLGQSSADHATGHARSGRGATRAGEYGQYLLDERLLSHETLSAVNILTSIERGAYSETVGTVYRPPQ